MVLSQVVQADGRVKTRFKFFDSAGIEHVTQPYWLSAEADAAAFEAEIAGRFNTSLKESELNDALYQVNSGKNPFPAEYADFKYNTRAEVLKHLFDRYFEADFNGGLDLLKAVGLLGLVDAAEIKSAGGYSDEQMALINGRVTDVVTIKTLMDGYNPPLGGA